MVVYSDDDDSDDEYSDIGGSLLDLTQMPAREIGVGVSGMRQGGQPVGDGEQTGRGRGRRGADCHRVADHGLAGLQQRERLVRPADLDPQRRRRDDRGGWRYRRR